MKDSGDSFELSRMRALIEGWYPAPVARAFARVAARSDADEAAAVVELSSVMLRYLALVSIRDLLSTPEHWLPDTPAVLVEAFQRPLADGRWLDLLRHALEARRSAEARAEAVMAFEPDLIRLFFDQGLEKRLGEMVVLRNDLVHERRHDLIPELKRSVAAVLGELTSLRFHRLLVPRDREDRDGGHATRYRATLYRGHAVPYPTVLVETEAELQTGQVYLSRAGQSEVLSLYPCFIEKPCASCSGEPELFLLAHRKKGPVHAVSPATGHVLDELESRPAGTVLDRLIERLEKRTGRFAVRRFDVGGDTLVAQRRLAPGEVVGGRYRVQRFLASGGMADVYEACDEVAGNQQVALKMLPMELARSEEMLRRFYAEVKQARAVEHRNVVRYLDHGEDRGDHYLALELANGWPVEGTQSRAVDVAALLRETQAAGRKVLPEATALAIALDVADGLHAIHEKGIVHRDLKPANILLLEDKGVRRAKVADFGVSRERGAATMTLTGFALGTPEYVAPEQALGRMHGAQAGREVDLYALGIVLYEMLSGEVPFRGGTALETLHLHQKRRPEWLKRSAPHVSDALARVVMKCLRKDPKERYRSAAELYRDLRRLQEEPGADPVKEAEPEAVGLGPGFRLGAYKLGEELARDEELTCYEALDERTGETVQVGVFSHALEADPVARKEALERLHAAQRVRHPALLAVREVDEEQGYCYFVSDEPEGVPLSQLGRLPVGQAIRLVLELAAGLLAFEEAGLGHGRVVPERIFVAGLEERKGHSYVRLNPFLDEVRGRARLGLLALAPSRISGATASDPRSLGAVLLRLVRGVEQQSTARPRRIGGDLGIVIEQALSGGYAGMRPFGEDVAAVLRLEPLRHARRRGRLQRMLKWARRNPLFVLGPAAVLLLASGFVVRLGQERTEAKRQLARLYEEQGRQEMLHGNPFQALAYLSEAYNEYGPRPSLRLLLSLALQPIDAHVATLEGHSNGVWSAAFSPDGSRIVTASGDGTAKVWDAATGRLRSTLSGHAAGVESAAFSPDGSRIVTASADRTAKLWDTATGRLLSTLASHSEGVSSAAFSPDGSRVVTASADRTAKLWDTATGRLLSTLSGHAAPVRFASFGPDGSRVVTTSFDSTAKLWDTATGQLRITLEGHSDVVRSAAFSPDGSLIVTASGDGTAKLWETATGRLLNSLEGHSDGVRSASFSPDGSRIVTASFDGTAKLWDTATGQLVTALVGHAGGVSSAAFSPDGSRVVTASDDKTAKVWDTRTGQLLGTLVGHSDWVNSASFSPDGIHVVTSSRDRTAKLWSTATSQLRIALVGHSAPVRSAAFSPDGLRIVTASRDRTAKLWDVASGRLGLTLVGHSDWVGSAAFHPDGSRVVTASGDGTAKVWDTATGRVLKSLESSLAGVEAAAFSPDGSRIVTASWDGTARIWDPATGRLLITLEGHSDGVESAAFSPDGLRIVTGSADGTAKVWDAATGRLQSTLEGHSDVVESAAFSLDGLRIVTASGDGTAKVWDTATGGLLMTLVGHSALVRSAAFSPDGSLIVTASGDGTAKVWDTSTGQLLANLEGHSAAVESAAFSPDGSRIVTASDDGTARLWPMHLETRNARQVARLVKCFSPWRLDEGRLIPASPELSACQDRSESRGSNGRAT
jgi:WD40 repeat protein